MGSWREELEGGEELRGVERGEELREELRKKKSYGEL